MSEINDSKERRIEGLMKLFYSILNKDEAVKSIEENRELIASSIPSDIIFLVDRIVRTDLAMDKIKIGVNKFLNVMYKSIENYTYEKPQEGSFIYCCLKNNEELADKLKILQPLIAGINKKPEDTGLKKEILIALKVIYKIDNYYIIKENVLFPLLEKKWNEFNCLKVMWSFHDDIRTNLKKLMILLSKDIFDLKSFNRLIGAVYFNINAIIFRDKKILFPFIFETIPNDLLNTLLSESLEIGFPYYNPKENIINNKNKERWLDLGDIDLQSGSLSVDQIILLFNNLPVDITFVDEHNKVKFFSTPKKRIFPRTNAIIGRDVKNCHPPESVHIVEEIIDSFRQGKQDKAEFWIKMGSENILIQYFAVYDDFKNYKGVIEVSQEITEIKKINGEKKLLDWD